jgi:ribosomal protein S27AE
MKAGLTQGRCPKCGGNLFLDSDHYGWYEQCLQCSYTGYLETIIDRRDGSDKSIGQTMEGKSNRQPQLVKNG